MSLDTAKARAAIFARIRTNQGRKGPIADSERAAATSYLESGSSGPRPSAPADSLQHFCAAAERMSSHVEQVARFADAPRAIAAYLQRMSLSTSIVGWPSLKGLDWRGAGLQFDARPPRRDESTASDLVGVTGCFCAIAETGTLMLLSGPHEFSSTHLLPETHIAIVAASRIVNDMEQAFALVRAERGALPRALNMVSGPSRTGDIEQTIVLGAHGPFRVLLVIATGE